jgi:hypothetical protein
MNGGDYNGQRKTDQAHSMPGALGASTGIRDEKGLVLRRSAVCGF